MPWIDAHLDLAYVGLAGRDLAVACPDSKVACVSLPALREAKVDLVCATIFTEVEAEDPGDPSGYADHEDLDGAEAAGRRQLELYLDLEARGELSIVRGPGDLDGGPRPRVVLLMECADPIRDAGAVAWWHERGLRMVGLSWARGSRYAGGNGRPAGLTERGRSLVAALDAHGIVHDVSHLPAVAVDELLSLATGPVVATHSNCRAVVGDDERHLCDAHITAIGERDGVIGLNLFTKFLRVGKRASIDDCVAHVEHVCDVLGHRRGVGLGSDMDGGFGPASLPEGLDHPGKLERLGEALAARGWSDEEVEGFRWGNWRRLLEQSLPGSPRPG
jgi:membrane dipeptidase